MYPATCCMRTLGLITVGMLSLGEPLEAEEHERALFTFDAAAAADAWQTVNDGVMGGLSEGRFQITEEKTMRFFGTLSLENNGGFASVRSRPTRLNLKEGEILAARIRGDGREYFWNLYVPSREMAFSYRAPFKTEAGEWIEVRVPLKDFYATSFGRRVPKATLQPDQVDSLGFLLADKKPGPFEMEVEWIKVYDL